MDATDAGRAVTESLRERKKRLMRLQLSDTAAQMFIEHGGFDRCPDVKDRLGRPRRTRTFPNANRDWKAAMIRAGFDPTLRPRPLLTTRNCC